MPDSGEAPESGGRLRRVQIPIRTTEEFRSRLQAAADQNGRSLTQEVEQRLESSLQQEIDRGGPETAALLANILADIAKVEGALGCGWRSKLEAHAAVRKLLTLRLSLETPAGPNDDAILAARDNLDAAEHALAGLLGFLLTARVIEPAPPEREAIGGMFGARYVPNRLTGVPTTLGAHLAARYQALSAIADVPEAKERTQAIVKTLGSRGFRATVELERPPEEWTIGATSQEKVGYEAMLAKLPELADAERKARHSFLEAYAVKQAEIEKGERMALRLFSPALEITGVDDGA